MPSYTRVKRAAVGTAGGVMIGEDKGVHDISYRKVI